MATPKHSRASTSTPQARPPIAISQTRNLEELISYGLTLAAKEEEHTDDESCLSTMSALESIPEYAQLRQQFRAEDRQRDRWNEDVPAEEQGGADFALRNYGALLFRAGLLAGASTGQSILQFAPTVIKPIAFTYAQTQPSTHSDFANLPFVRDHKPVDGCRRTFWVCPESKGYQLDIETGHRFAASYLKYLRTAKPHSTLLGNIVGAMPRPWDGFTVGFLDQVETYAGAHAKSYTAEIIDWNTEAQIAHSRKVIAAAEAQLGIA